MKELKENLSQFGNVTECSGNDETFTVTINGYDNNGLKTFDCIKVINDSVADKYPMTKSCVIDTNKFHYVLKVK